MTYEDRDKFSYKTLALIYQTVWRHVSGNRILNIRRSDKATY